MKVFSDDGHCVADGRVMRRALEYVRAFDGVVSQHSQDPNLAGPQACCHEGELSGRLGLPGWPPVAEASIIARDALLAEHTRSRVHVAHVSTAEGLDVVRWAKARGIRMTAEVTPHHLALGTDLLAGYDPVYKVNPPLRPTEDREALVEGLLDGTIDAVATDHAPHARHDKEHAFVDAAFGMLGLETAFAVVHDLLVADGRLDWAHLTRLMSTGPARIAGLADHGHPVAAGAPANLVLVDPTATVSVDRDASQSLSRNTPWHGQTPHRRRPHHDPARPRHGPWRGAHRMLTTREPAVLILEDGRTFTGRAYGHRGSTVGEAVFSTGMTGYQETLTDPSYHRQVVVMTAPHVGNTGWNDEDDESGRIWVAGYVVRDPALRPSNWRSNRSLEDELDAQGVVGICDLDTRALTRHLRERGAMRVGIFSGDAASAPRERLLTQVIDSPAMEGASLAEQVATDTAYVVPAVGEKRLTVAAVDLGIKSMTPQMMAERGIEVHVLPATAIDRRRARGRARRRLLLQRSRRPRDRAGAGRSCSARCWATASRTSASASATRSSARRSGSARTS